MYSPHRLPLPLDNPRHWSASRRRPATYPSARHASVPVCRAGRGGADDVEGLRQRGTEGGGALQDGAKRIDFDRRPVGEIGDGAVVDLAVFAEALAEEDSGRGVAVGDDSDIHVDIVRGLPP